MSGNILLLDTNIVGAVLSDGFFFKKNFKEDSSIIISVITKFEFLCNPHLTAKDKYLFEAFMDSIEVYELLRSDTILQKHIISIRKKYKLKLPAAIIAATALVCNATLISGEDIFYKIDNLKFKHIII